MYWNEIMKYTFRLVPCSIYQNEIMESWLEELALQGLVLVNISLGVILGAWVGALGALIGEYETDTVDHIEYKVTIDDSVSMNEFLDKYEIIDQEGKIYTVKEKE